MLKHDSLIYVIDPPSPPHFNYYSENLWNSPGNNMKKLNHVVYAKDIGIYSLSYLYIRFSKGGKLAAHSLHIYGVLLHECWIICY